MLKVGIVGLPNVGKSSLFNALTAAGAPSENYPFCTVEPNVGTVEVPDVRLDRIHQLAESKTRVPTVIQFVDIAGLVEGASEGEGLGNKFLGNIREVDAIAHVLRCFDDEDITHVLGNVDPARDRDIVETELALSDLDTVQRRLDKVNKKAKSGEKDAIREQAVLEKALDALEAGKPVRAVNMSQDDLPILKGFQLLTTKPVLYVANVGEADLPDAENEWTRALREAVAAAPSSRSRPRPRPLRPPSRHSWTPPSCARRPRALPARAAPANTARSCTVAGRGSCSSPRIGPSPASCTCSASASTASPRQ